MADLEDLLQLREEKDLAERRASAEYQSAIRYREALATAEADHRKAYEALLSKTRELSRAEWELLHVNDKLDDLKKLHYETRQTLLGVWTFWGWVKHRWF